MGKAARSVSIIGVGCTVIGDVRKSKEIKDYTERELFAEACMNAMEDAGISPKEIDAFYVGISGPNYDAKIKSASPQFGQWIGMKGKPSLFHDEGCGTACFGLEAAVNAIASGRYDCIISGSVNVNTCVPVKGCYPPFVRGPQSNDALWDSVWSAADPAYDKPGYGGGGALDADVVDYCVKNHVTLQQMDDAYVNFLLGKRKEAVMNPIAVTCNISFEEEAKMMGFSDPHDYLKSETFNPRMGTTLRARYIGQTNVDAGAAVIVCATELAGKYRKEPIEVAGITTSTCLATGLAESPVPYNVQMFQECYRQAGITDPYHEIQLMSIHDCPINVIVPVAEAAGYLKTGEGWKDMLNGELNYNGSRPINTSGSRTQTGHPRSAAFNIELRECVQQMRGESGDRQVREIPKAAALWAGGAAYNLGACVLKKL